MFLVITCSAVPDHLHGYLTRLLSEVDTGVYVGNVSRRVRNNLWTRCATAIKSGRLTMINRDPEREQGFAVNTLGSQRRTIIDMDGLLLASTLLPARPKNPPRRK